MSFYSRTPSSPVVLPREADGYQAGYYWARLRVRGKAPGDWEVMEIDDGGWVYRCGEDYDVAVPVEIGPRIERPALCSAP